MMEYNAGRAKTYQPKRQASAFLPRSERRPLSQPIKHKSVSKLSSTKLLGYFRKIPKKIKIVLLIIFAALMLTQILWPSNRARPFAKVADISVGTNNKEQIKQKLEKLSNESTFKLKLEDKIISSKWIDAGIALLGDSSSKKVVYYPWWQRLMPLSLFTAGIHQAKPDVRIDKQNVKELSKQWTKSSYKAAKNAGVKVDGTTATIDSSKSGYRFDEKQLVELIENGRPSVNANQIVVPSIEVKPVRFDKDIEPVVKQAQRAINTPISISFNKKTVTAESPTIASWLSFSESSDKKQLALDINPEVVKTYLTPLEKEVYKAPGTTTVTVADGVEVGRKLGDVGKGLDQAKTTEAIKKVITDQKTNQIALTISDIPAQIQFNRSYSKTSRGLQALLDTTVKEKGDFAISIIEVGGLGRSASANGAKRYHPASTYKLFVAGSILRRIEANQMHWSDPSPVAGRNVEQCFDAMIIRSDNACAEAFGKQITWAAVQSEARAAGAANTILTSNFQSTTDDQVAYLKTLSSGGVAKDELRDKLLSVMRSQIFRQGIPAGAGGAVADKVGFLNGLLHDSGIVYSKHGTYIISIYSNGSSWAQIADATKQIEAYFAQ